MGKTAFIFAGQGAQQIVHQGVKGEEQREDQPHRAHGVDGNDGFFHKFGHRNLLPGAGRAAGAAPAGFGRKTA